MLGVGTIYLSCTYNPDRVYDFCSNIRRGRRFLCEEISLSPLLSLSSHPTSLISSSLATRTSLTVLQRLRFRHRYKYHLLAPAVNLLYVSPSGRPNLKVHRKITITATMAQAKRPKNRKSGKDISDLQGCSKTLKAILTMGAWVVLRTRLLENLT